MEFSRMIERLLRTLLEMTNYFQMFSKLHSMSVLLLQKKMTVLALELTEKSGCGFKGCQCSSVFPLPVCCKFLHGPLIIWLMWWIKYDGVSGITCLCTWEKEVIICKSINAWLTKCIRLGCGPKTGLMLQWAICQSSQAQKWFTRNLIKHSEADFSS